MPESLAVATASPVDFGHAPVPASAAERFAFAQSYETLIDVDCEGHPRPGLAQSWAVGGTGSQVTVVLRDGARFWNGDPVRAADVVAAWQTAEQRATGDSLLAARLALGTRVVDEKTLIISLPDSSVSLLALPALAIARPASDSGWPEGTGPYRPVRAAGGTSESIELMPVTAGDGPRLVIGAHTAARRGPAVDLRDALDAGADLIPDAGPEAATYAAARADVTVIALPWDRTYLLAVPDTTAFLGRTAALPDLDASPAIRASLPRDAVRADARVPEPPFWWHDMSLCSFHLDDPPPSGSTRGTARIVYPAGDPVARDLAERLVALGHGLTAAGLSDAAFADALRTGRNPAYVIAVPHRSLMPCRDLGSLWSSAPWMSQPGSSLVPLVDTRRRAIVRRGRISATIAWDGTLRIATPWGRP